jgi:TldD protein
MRDLCHEAVDAALAAGAEYADARAVVQRDQQIATKDGRVETTFDAESEGIGVRVLVDGAWGFACSDRLDEKGARDAAARATGFARAAHGGNGRALAPVEPATGSYRTPVERDPFAVPLSEKIDLCLRAEEAARHPGVKVTAASARSFSQRKHLVSSAGTDVEQELVECGAGLDAIAAGDGLFQQRSYPSAFGGSSGQGGWEYVESLGLEREAPRVGEEAAALLRADPCPAGVTTVVIGSEQMALQVHESVGHPTELDRVYGTEAAYAGTSFLSTDDLGSLRYGSALMNVTADARTPGGLGTFGWDDEGIAAQTEPIVAEGVLSGFLTSRETAARLGRGTGGSMRAETWNRMPLVRMTNLHLEPVEQGSLEDLLADVDDGIYLSTNRSWSIDDKRLNFQFGTQVAWEIKRGRLGRMFRDAIYTGITPQFWGSLDALGGRDTWVLYGLTNCGKGQPGQSAHVSHGAPIARFRNVQVGVRP